MSEFITLKSNSSKLSLDSEPFWRVGIKEISFSRPLTVPIDQIISIIYYEERNFYKELIKPTAVIHKGEYTLEELIEKCNKAIKAYFVNLIMKNDEETGIKMKPQLLLRDNRVYMNTGLTVDNEKFYVKFDNCLGRLLGFPTHDLINHIQSVYSTYAETKLNNGRVNDTVEEFSLSNHDISVGDYIVIKSDMCENSQFGSQSIPLLKVVDLSENKRTTRIYENPQFYPLKQLSSVNLEVCNNFGDPIELDKFYITLEIKKDFPEYMLEPLVDGELESVKSEDHPFNLINM